MYFLLPGRSGLICREGRNVSEQMSDSQNNMSLTLAQRGDKAAIEEGLDFTPKFASDGTIVAVSSDAENGNVLMLAYMNAESLALTLNTGIAHYWSRSRQKLWKKGETSGNLQQVVEIRTDCDQDALWLKVKMQGAGLACHTDRPTCFYRTVPLDQDSGTPVQLKFDL